MSATFPQIALRLPDRHRRIASPRGLPLYTEPMQSRSTARRSASAQSGSACARLGALRGSRNAMDMVFTYRARSWRHVSIGVSPAIIVVVAEQFLGVPYVWGGRSSHGIDCSALVQLALPKPASKRRAIPIISVKRRASRLAVMEPLAQMRRGDLVFWNNHVAIALDDKRILHANALAMAVSIDEAIPFARRCEPTEGPVIAVKRLK